MKEWVMPFKSVLAILLFFACASTQPVVTPPIVTPPKPEDTVIKHDTVIVHDPIVQLVLGQVTANLDTACPPYYLTPSGGDDWPAAQMMLNSTGIVHFSPGSFKMSHGLLKTALVNGQFSQTWFDIEGAANAQNAAGGTTTLIFTNPQSFGIAFQQAKGAAVKNLILMGPYTKAGGAPGKPGLTQLQIDTLPYSGWQDGSTRFAPTSPCAGIVIDPFSDRSNFPDTTGMYPGYSSYYFSGMNQSGSTAVEISGVQIEDFAVGILITAVNQANGENNQILNCKIDQCASAIAFTQAQAKTNYVKNLMSWGQTRIVFDGQHYGLPHADAATCPVVDEVNIAGFTRELLEIDTRSFSASLSNVYGEGLYMLGFTGASNSRGAGVHFTDCQIDFQNASRTPSYWYHGGGTLFEGGHLRYYNNGNGPRRIVLNDVGDELNTVVLSGPPIIVQGEAQIPMTVVVNCGMFYDWTLGGTLSGSGYDSVTGGGLALVRCNRTTFTGYYLTSDTTTLPIWTPILTQGPDQADSANIYQVYGPPYNFQEVLGYVTRISKDTVFLAFMGDQIRDSTIRSIYPARFRKIN